MKACIVGLKGTTKIVEVIFYGGPTFLNELIAESIRPRRLIIW